MLIFPFSFHNIAIQSDPSLLYGAPRFSKSLTKIGELGIFLFLP